QLDAARMHGPAFSPSARCIPQMGDHCGPTACLLTRPLGQVRGPHILPMPCRDFAGMHTSLGLVGETAAHVGKGGLIVCDQGVQTALAFLKRRASRLATTRAMNAGQAWGGPCCLSVCLVWNQQRLRRDLGHTSSTALISPGAPSVVL